MEIPKTGVCNVQWSCRRLSCIDILLSRAARESRAQTPPKPLRDRKVFDRPGPAGTGTGKGQHRRESFSIAVSYVPRVSRGFVWQKAHTHTGGLQRRVEVE